MTTTEIVERIRKEKNISRRKLAKLAGIPASSLQSALNRGGNLPMKMIVPILAVFGSPIDDIASQLNVPVPTVSTALINGYENSFKSKILGVVTLLSGESELDKNSSDDQSGNIPESYKAIARSIVEDGQKQELIQLFDQLNYDGKEEALERLYEMTLLPKYVKHDSDYKGDELDGN